MSADSPRGLPVVVRVGLWMTLSAVSFAALIGIVRHLTPEMNVYVVNFWRNVVSAALFAPWLMHQGFGGLRTRRHGTFALRAALMIVATVTLYEAVALMPMAEVTSLTFTSPLFATALALLVLGEKVGPRRWLALVIGFSGVLVILRPGFAELEPAALLALLCALAFAGVVVTGKMLASSESPESIVLYLSIWGLPLALLPALFVWQWPTFEQALWLLAMGLFGNANMYGFARAFRIGDASLAMPFDFIRLPFTALVGYLAFAQRPDVWVWIGAAVIFAGSAYVTHREALAQRRAQSQGKAP
ncbi:MAG TPA: DMT family transporter [Alphaproteobacteria bacterium]|nr:DMT family transporter [Alphaproteobacteria bacterium]MDP6269258.1 DMT family transporter [Alphaproteobacteria bacterium]MDP7165045.1 DMT family transporter [Alphaproteobacteria bacterium]HJM48636.1 DMT family transporter [Alphaproteobacteria bacterium]